MLKFLVYLHNLSQQTCGEFLEVMRWPFQKNDELQAESNQTLWSLIFSLKVEEHDRNVPNAGKAWYTLIQELGIEHEKSEGSRVWAAQTRTGMDA